MKNYRAARKRVTVSVGESVRIIRELQGLSQNELAQRTGISQATISGIENDRVKLGVERARPWRRRSSATPACLCSPAGLCLLRRRHNHRLQRAARARRG
jgi:transcriptional regulator with XRE-family HTH domain